MVYREVIAVCSQIHTKHLNTLCGQNVELLNVKLAVHIVATGFALLMFFVCLFIIQNMCFCTYCYNSYFRRSNQSYIFKKHIYAHYSVIFSHYIARSATRIEGSPAKTANPSLEADSCSTRQTFPAFPVTRQLITEFHSTQF
jgi:hypothetical protein